MDSSLKTLKNLQQLAFGNDIVEDFQKTIIDDAMSMERTLGVSVKIKNGKTFRIKFREISEIKQRGSFNGASKTLLETYFTVAEGFEAQLEELLQILSPPAPKHTDWNLRKIKFVLGEINTWSKDPSTKVSAAIFNGKYPICSSYNGFPPGVEDTEERLNNRPLKYKIVQHAEANAITTCARLGIKTEGMSMAVSLFPCTTCAGMIIGAGIKEVITVEPSEDAKSRWAEDFALARQLFDEAGVRVIVVNVDKT